MKIVKMKDALGNLQSRIPEKDIPYHLKNGWELVGVSYEIFEGSLKNYEELKSIGVLN